MAGAAEILREYFVSLGFKVDQKGSKNFESTMVGIGVKANLVTDAIEGVAKAAISMAQHYADSMQDLYRSSRHLGASAENVQAFGFAGKQAGVDWMAGANMMRSALQKMEFRAFQSKLLGREVKESDDPTQDIRDVVKAIKGHKELSMQMKQIYFGLSGGSPESYMDLENTVDEVDKKAEAAKKRAQSLGLNLTEMSAAGNEWNQAMGDFGLSVDLVKGVVLQKMLPTMKDLVRQTSEWSDQMIKDIGSSTSLGDLINKRRTEAIAGGDAGMPWGGGTTLDINVGGAGSSFKKWLLGFSNGGKGPKGGPAPEPALTGTPTPDTSGQFGRTGKTKKEIEDAIQNFSDAMGVPADYVRAIVSVESNNGMNMVSPTGVRGLTQITSANARRLGGDRNDPFDSIRMTAQMLKENYASTGSWDRATNMYSGNGSAPLGTTPPGGDPHYLDKIHAAIEQHNHITVNGGDSGAIIPAVSSAIDRSNGNLIRDFRGNMQ